MAESGLVVDGFDILIQHKPVAVVIMKASHKRSGACGLTKIAASDVPAGKTHPTKSRALGGHYTFRHLSQVWNWPT